MYQVLKDFAGPVATIIASITAAGITWYFASRQAKIAQQQADTARQQANTAFDQLRLNLFEKRLAVHSAARNLIATVTSYGKVENKDIFDFLSGIQPTRWLLDESIVNYLENDLWPRVNKLQELIDMRESPEQDRGSNARQQRELKEWIAGQRANLDAQFDEFLKFLTKR
jgi:type II secretory pathway pseudopilin PulG